MRLGIFYYGTDAKNRGLGQLSESLRELGHEPIIVTRRPRSGKTIREFNNIPVIQVPSNCTHCAHLVSNPIPLNILWSLWATNLTKKYKLEGIFVRETPLSWQVLTTAKKLSIPVFLDLRENLGEAYAAANKNKKIRRLLRQKRLVNLYESVVVPKFSHIFASTYELAMWLARDYKVKPKDLSVIGNYPSKSFLEQADRAIREKENWKSRNTIRMVHAGYVLESRGLQDIVKALAVLAEKKVVVFLRIIGEGTYTTELKRLVEKFGLNKNVEFLPMLPPENVPKALAKCDIGVCSYLLNEQTHQTLPGKLFEYMAVGLPILSSARKPVVRIIEETGSGLIYRSRKPEDIAEKILELISNRNRMEEMGRKGREAVLRRYNWKTNLDKLNRVLDRFTQ
ncbi:hypothetical protein DRJ22_06400 [Candidatus Woesearchaeota archaeon]|nr:MAG: hypothetical protein DRJ22_06400 [Candidatus Woesearchaeota archaeon]